MPFTVGLLLFAAAFVIPLFMNERKQRRRARHAAMMRQFAQTSDELEKNELKRS